MKPPSLITKKTRRSVEEVPTVGAEDPTDQRSPLVGKTRSDWRVDEFIRVIRQKGYYCTWRKAMVCPCLNLSTNQVALNCLDCGGSGYQYIEPHLIQVIMSSFDKNVREYEKPGSVPAGTAKGTCEPQYRLGYRDSLELRDSIITYNEYVIRGDREGRRSRLPSDRLVDSARYRIIRVVGALFRDPSTKRSVVLEADADYRVSDEGWLEWTPAGARKVQVGTIVSLNYEFKPIYIVTSHSNVLRNTLTLFKKAVPTVESLPLQVDLMLDYLVRDTDLPAPVGGEPDDG